MQSNKLILTIKLTSLQALISLTDKLKLHSNNIRIKNDFTTYLPYILSQGIIDCIRTIKPDIQQRRLVKYTKNIALSIGIITSALVSVRYDGANYIINFTFTLIKTTGTTLIIDKLNQLKTVDGVSVAILINLILSIPSIIAGLSTQPLLSGLLFIASLGVMAYGNFKLLQNTEDVNVHYKDTKDKFSISTRNTYTTALIISNFITSLAPNPIIQSSLMIVVNPLVQWFLSTSTDIEEINNYLKHTNGFIDGLKHGKDTEDCLKHMIRNNSVKLGFIGVITFIVCSLLVKVFAIAISPIMLSITVNSFINVCFSVKTLIKCNKQYVRLRGVC